MIETKNLTKTFDNFTAVDSLNLKIEKGEFFGLLGPNGAGKTTTISLLSTLLLPTKGEILIDGQQLTRQRLNLKRKISVITQEYSMRQDMNMDEIMEYQGRLYFMPRKQIKERTEELLEFCDLLKFRKRTVRKLSGGMKRKLMVCRALLTDPEILLLDEPTAGLDVMARDDMLEILREYMETPGRSILISSHISTDLEGICDDIYMIDEGKILLHEETDKLLDQYGLLKVKADQYEALEKEYILAHKKEEYGYSCLTNERQYYQENYPDITIEKGKIDDVIIMMKRGQQE